MASQPCAQVDAIEKGQHAPLTRELVSERLRVIGASLDRRKRSGLIWAVHTKRPAPVAQASLAHSIDDRELGCFNLTIARRGQAFDHPSEINRDGCVEHQQQRVRSISREVRVHWR
ncbi:MAG: hypothetical protein KC766_23975, partial [Myxococcales bacterium]|nr:hypothetical protein [Myxococcales bacterium]